MRSRRGLWGLVSLILAILLIIIILLMLRSCAERGDDDNGATTQTIEPVLGSDPVEGMISLWIRDGANVSTVLRDAGIASDGSIDMGDGNYTVTVRVGSEARSVEALKGVAGVLDAGRVYAGGSPTPGSKVETLTP